MTSSSTLNPIAITIGLFVLAGVFLVRHEDANAILCACLAVPNAGQALALVNTPAASALLAELQTIRKAIGNLAGETATPIPQARRASSAPPGAPSPVVAIELQNASPKDERKAP